MGSSWADVWRKAMRDRGEGGTEVRVWQHPDTDPEILETTDLEVWPGEAPSSFGLDVTITDTVVESESDL